MSTAILPRTGLAARDAVPADNAALIELAAACPMQGDVGLCVDRAPDFFALNRLEGERWNVGVVDAPGGLLAGCVAVAERGAYLHGQPARTLYVSDLKVHPAHRGGGAADVLTRFARECCREMGGEDAATLLTVLAGNHSVERRAAGPRETPGFARFATIRSYAIPLLRRRRPPANGVRISRATPAAIEPMAELWRQVAPGRQLAPAHDAESLAHWIRAAPGLSVEDYLLARGPDGRLAGFVGLWEQDSLKRLRVTGYSRRLAIARTVFNALARPLGATPLPLPGDPLRCRTIVHLCVPRDRPAALRCLLIHAHNALLGRGVSFLNVGLDLRDPLRIALRGLLAQPTDVHAYVTTPSGRYGGPALDDRPLHFEIALV